MRVILPPSQHDHDMPPYGRPEYPIRTLAQCDECGQWFWMRAGDYGPSWVPLRWYHWRLRAALDGDGAK